MGIIVKFILKNICEKKFRTFLILFSITLSAALFFASSAMSGTMMKMYKDRLKQYFGTSEILVHAGEKSPSPFMSPSAAEPMGEHLEYVIGAMQGKASYKYSGEETVNISLSGFDLDQLQSMNPVVFHSESRLLPFTGSKIILSRQTAEKYGLQLGDSIDLQMNGKKVNFTICALAHPSGPFLDESQSTGAIVPLETLSALYYAKGRSSILYIKTKDPLQIEAVMEDLRSLYKRYTVREPLTKAELAQQTGPMSTSFLLMTFIVTLMSVFIIYSSFKVVTTERLPVIGTFRSIGATRKMTSRVLLAESILYGVIGGLAGCVLGIGILYIMAYMSRPVYMQGFKAAVQFSPAQLVTAFLIAVVLSFVSCVIPILKVSRIPVKDIVLNTMQKAAGKTVWKFILGLVMTALAITAPAFTPRQLSMPVGVLAMVLSICSVVLLVPYITGVLVKIFEKLYTLLFGNVGILAAKNLKENRNILNNIALLAIGISSLLMINTLSSSVMREVTNLYRDAKFGIWVESVWQGDRSTERLLNQCEGVEEVYGIYEARQVEVDGRNGAAISLLQGVDTGKYLDYWNMNIDPDLLQQLNGERTVILADAVRERFGLKAGDTLLLRLKQKDKPYRVIGFVNTLMFNGSFALISERNLRLDTGMKYFSNIYIKTSEDPAMTLPEVRKAFGRRSHSMLTVQEMETRNQKSNENIFNILKGFSLMALVIGIFGVLNNLVISFIERRRSIAMLRSIGMSRKQTVHMIFIEALTGGLIGGMTGIAAGYLLVRGIPYVLKAMNLAIPVTIEPWSLAGYIAAGVVITLAASISPALKSSRMNVIQAIKYE